MEAGQEPWRIGALDNAKETQGLKAAEGAAAPPLIGHVSGDWVFGSWNPAEFPELLSSASCPGSHMNCLADEGPSKGGAEKAGLQPADVRSGHDECFRHGIAVWTQMSYQEWISRRQPCKLPPGLPRPPRQPGPAPLSSPRVTYDDEDLDSEWDEWYNRNVASGAFTDWWSVERSSMETAGSQPCNCSDASPAGIDEFRCRAEGGSPASSVQREDSIIPRCTLAADPAPAAPAVPCSPSALLLFVRVDTSLEKADGPAADLAVACVDIASGTEADCDVPDHDGGGVPLSPTGSDCHAASDDLSRDTSRSCSLLSLQSWDVQGVGGDEVDSELDPEHWEGFPGSVGCGLCGTNRQPSIGREGYTDKGHQGCHGGRSDESFCFSVLPLVDCTAVLPLVDCTAWETEVDASTTSAGCKAGRLPPYSASMPEWVCPEWFEADLSRMLKAVVSAALYDVCALEV